MPVRRSAPNNRQAILAAAREELAVRGYEGMTLRQVAARAGVDPRLVRYYFTSKQDLVRACIAGRFEEEPLGADVLNGDESSVGQRLVRRVLRTWEEQPVSCRALLAAAMSEEEGAGDALRTITSAVEPVVARFAPDRHPLRSALICAQLIGLWMAIGVAGTLDLRRSTEQLVPTVGEVVQRLISAPLPAP